MEREVLDALEATWFQLTIDDVVVVLSVPRSQAKSERG
jgi:hypothetical protein